MIHKLVRWEQGTWQADGWWISFQFRSTNYSCHNILFLKTMPKCHATANNRLLTNTTATTECHHFNCTLKFQRPLVVNYVATLSRPYNTKPPSTRDSPDEIVSIAFTLFPGTRQPLFSLLSLFIMRLPCIHIRFKLRGLATTQPLNWMQRLCRYWVQKRKKKKSVPLCSFK